MPPRSSQSRSARSSSIRSRRTSHRETGSQATSESRSSSRRRTPTPSPTRPSASHPNRKRFGLNAPTNQPRIGKFDFEEIYPEDPIHEELGPNARAWRVNLDECEVFDNDMVVEARDGLDLLLVFAGLFSAVLTTFVVQTSQALSNNFPAVSTSLLLEMVSLQRAFINGTSIDGISSSEMTSGPSGFDVWVNALWFTSLTLSLGTALMAVLVKQWLYQYMSIVSGTARDRSLIRFYRFDGLRKWHVLTIIGTLPVVLHIAVGLFLAGLVVFLIPLNVPLASIVGVITTAIYTMYTVSNILPIVYTQCPYRTPFSDILNILMHPIFMLLSFISSSAPARVLSTFFAVAVASFARLYTFLSTSFSSLLRGPEEILAESSSSSFVSSDSYTPHPPMPLSPIARAMRTFFKSVVASAARFYRLCSTHLFTARSATFLDPSTSPKIPFSTLKEAERIAATGNEAAEVIACDALMWLYQMTSNPPTKNIILQSVGCLSGGVSDRLTVVNADLEKALGAVVYQLETAEWTIRPGQESRAERLLRAQRHIKEPQPKRQWWEADSEAFSPPFHILSSILTYPHTKSVQIQGRKHPGWYRDMLFMQIMQEYRAGRAILLPTTVWQQFLTVVRRNFHLGDIAQNLLLCRLAVQSVSLDNVNRSEQTASPFSGGVPLTHDTVRLNHVVTDLLPQNNFPDSEFRQLYIIHDYVVSMLSTNRYYIALDTVSILQDIWERFPKATRTFPPGDSQAICRCAEKCMLELFVGDWWDGLSESDVLNQCYRSVLRGYWHNTRRGRVLPSPELFTKLFSEMCWSGLATTMSDYVAMTNILVLALTSQDVESAMACYTLFCGSESPLFSPRTKFPPRCSGYLCRVIVTFVSGLARAAYPQHFICQCMDSLCAEPDRLFTVCRLLAALGQVNFLGISVNKSKEVIKENLLNLVRVDPNRAAWKDRKHFLVGIEPWDWQYLSIPKDHASYKDIMVDAQNMMQFSLEVLDNFFASLESPPSSASSELQPVRLDSQLEPPTMISPWRRVRLMVFTTRAFRYGASSSPADIELASPLDNFEDHPSAGAAHRALAVEPAPPSSWNDALAIESASSNAAGKSLSRAIVQPGDDMV